jgi:hypothetical protein
MTKNGKNGGIMKMRKLFTKIVILLLITVLFGITTHAVNYEVEWAKNFGGLNEEMFNAVIATSDGGFLAVGYSNSVTSTSSGGVAGREWKNEDTTGVSSDAIVVKMDQYGVVEWAYNYGGDKDDSFNNVIEVASGGYIIVGVSDGASTTETDAIKNWGNHARQDGIVVYISATGAVIWAKNFGGVEHDVLTSIGVTPDGDYIIVGNSTGPSDHGFDGNGDPIPNWSISGPGTHTDGIAMKIKEDGSVVWAYNYGGAMAEDSLTAVIALPTLGDGYILIGYSNNVSTSATVPMPWGNNGARDGILIKVDDDGIASWAYNYGTDTEDNFLDATLLSNNEFLVVGYSFNTSAYWGHNGNGDALAIKFDKDGNIIWAKNFGDQEMDVFFSVETTTSGNIIAVGYQVDINIGEAKASAYEVDTQGNIIWNVNLGESGLSLFYDVAVVPSGGYLAVGASNTVSITRKGNDWGNVGYVDSIVAKLGEEIIVSTPPVTTPTVTPIVPKTGVNNSIEAYLLVITLGSFGIYFISKKRIDN